MEEGHEALQRGGTQEEVVDTSLLFCSFPVGVFNPRLLNRMSADADPTERWIEPVTGEFFASLCDACLVSGATDKAIHGWIDTLAPPEKRLAIEESWGQHSEVRSLFCFPEPAYIQRLKSEPIESLPNLGLVIIHMGDNTVPTEELEEILAARPTIRIWATNIISIGTTGRLRLLPLCEQNRQWREGGTLDYDPPVLVSRSLDRPYGIFATWRWDTNPLRVTWFEELKGLLLSGQRADIELFRYLEKDEYDARMKQSRAVLCPPGNGLDTHRVWEALQRGAWPILENNLHTKMLQESYPDMQLLAINQIADLPGLQIPEGLPPFPGLLTREWWREEVRRTLEDVGLLAAAAADV